MGQRSILLACLYSLICGIKADSDIDMDYYLGSLRSSCDPQDGDEVCRQECHGVPGVCHKRQCYCHHSVFNTKISTNEQDNREEVLATDEAFLYTQTIRPALRHHIAHFCPNLDIARKCIRKCMQEGKPAFCGKDHTCYCGHRYTAHDHNEEADAAQTYKNFKDLYEKYFGAQASGKDEIIEHSE